MKNPQLFFLVFVFCFILVREKPHFRASPQNFAFQFGKNPKSFNDFLKQVCLYSLYGLLSKIFKFVQRCFGKILLSNSLYGLLSYIFKFVPRCFGKAFFFFFLIFIARPSFRTFSDSFTDLLKKTFIFNVRSFFENVQIRSTLFCKRLFLNIHCTAIFRTFSKNFMAEH